jgi:hypothetical protein
VTEQPRFDLFSINSYASLQTLQVIEQRFVDVLPEGFQVRVFNRQHEKFILNL